MNIKRETETIAEQYKCKINVVDGQMQLFIQKNDQRAMLVKQESQIKSLTVDVLLKFIGFLGYELSDYKNKKKHIWWNSYVLYLEFQPLTQ